MTTYQIQLHYRPPSFASSPLFAVVSRLVQSRGLPVDVFGNRSFALLLFGLLLLVVLLFSLGLEILLSVLRASSGLAAAGLTVSIHFLEGITRGCG